MNKFFLLFLLACISNCITWTNFNPEMKNSKLIGSGTASKTIFINLKFDKTVYRHPAETSEETEEFKLKIVTICKESMLFKEIKTSLDRTDINLQIELKSRLQINYIFFFLNIFSFTIIPSVDRENIYMKYSFFDNKGNLIKEYIRRATSTNVYHITLLPLTPLMYDFDPYKTIFENITKSVLDEANRDGLFK